MKNKKEIANKMKEPQKTNDSSKKEDDIKNNSDNEDKSDNSDHGDDDDDFRCKEAIRYNKLRQKKKVQLPNINLDEYVRKYNSNSSSFFIVRYGYFW